MAVFPSLEHVQWPIEVAQEEITGARMVWAFGRGKFFFVSLFQKFCYVFFLKVESELAWYSYES